MTAQKRQTVFTHQKSNERDSNPENLQPANSFESLKRIGDN